MEPMEGKESAAKESESKRLEKGIFDRVSELKKMVGDIDISPESRKVGFKEWAAIVGFEKWITLLRDQVSDLSVTGGEYRRALYAEELERALQRAVDAGEFSFQCYPDWLLNNVTIGFNHEKGIVSVTPGRKDDDPC